jgi:hypothetical protein
MAEAGNSRFLVEAAAHRHNARITRARQAIEDLEGSRQPVSFIAVAEAAQVSRAWLYRHTDVRDAIIRLRTATSRPSGNPASQRATAESLRQLLDTARGDLTQLRAENLKLRDQLARSLGQQRARP